MNEIHHGLNEKALNALTALFDRKIITDIELREMLLLSGDQTKSSEVVEAIEAMAALKDDDHRRTFTVQVGKGSLSILRHEVVSE